VHSEDVSQEKILFQLSKGYFWDNAYVSARQTAARLKSLYPSPTLAPRDVLVLYDLCTDKVLEGECVGSLTRDVRVRARWG
jgi:hypothetical protein